MIEIRETRPAYLEKVRALWADGDVMRFVGFPEGLRKTEEEMRGWLRWIEAKRPGRNHYSIFEDGRYCGEAFYDIDPEHRSKGLATEFFEWLKSDKSIMRLRLEVEDHNKGAMRLYERMGFELLPYLQMVIDRQRNDK